MYVYVYYTTLPGTFGTLNPECASQQNVPASTVPVATLTSHLSDLIYLFYLYFSPPNPFLLTPPPTTPTTPTTPTFC